MLHTNFVHLHVHSHYSLLDGAARINDLVDAARRFHMPAVALTDHGSMFGAVEFYQCALKRGIKPIIGFEAYVCSKNRKIHSPDNKETFHLVLLAQNNEGYRNLVKLATFAYTEGFYYKPRIDHELLEQYSSGIIALSACLKGEIPNSLLKGDKEKAKEIVQYYQRVFGKNNFYIEIQNHGIAEQLRVLNPLVDLARECDAPLVATNDLHYVNPEDWEAQDALLCLGTNAKIDDEKRMRFGSRDFYFKSPQEMTSLFSEWPDALENTVLIAERCNVQLKFGDSILPEFDLPDGKTSESYLTELCNKGLIWRYGSDNPGKHIIERLEYELSVIKRMGFCDYFLIVWDFIDYAKRCGIPVGPGRGSAAGAIVAYLLGITDIDPLKYDLLFERFLNPERISMPDIDVDFSDEDRGTVLDYVKEKYGKGRVSQIITFNFMLAKMAIRDIGRVLGISLSEVDRIAKMVPDKPGTHIKKAISEVPELKEIFENGTPEQKKLLRIAGTVDGLARHTGVHACGVVVSKVDLQEIVPLYVDKDKNIVTQYEKKAVEDIGLLKMDFLGLKTLSILKNALNNIKESRGITIELERIPIDDQKVYALLSKGLSLGVFQLESSGMRSLLTRLRPTVFEDIVALLAMYRPGPLKSGMVEDFVKRKHGEVDTAYPHESLEPILKDTYGVYLYQEQVMKTSNVLAGFSMAQADGLRKAMGKKQIDKMEKLGKLFVKGAIEKGVDGELATKIYNLMAGFGEYGFNKSHSAAYAVITYRTAYLKTHYPVEFMAAVLYSEINNTNKIAEYIQECGALGIKILPPDINKSFSPFKVENDCIRFGLSGLKGIGEGAVEILVCERDKNGPYKSLSDLTRRVDTRVVNSRVIDALIKSGAFDEFGLKKSQLLAMTEEALKSGQVLQKNRNSGQTTFFDLQGDIGESMGNTDVLPPDIPELPDKELLLNEKEVFGFYLTGNPYASFSSIGKAFNTCSISDIFEFSERMKNKELKESELSYFCDNPMRISGILTTFKRHTTKKGDTMAFITLEADNATIDVSVFPKTYEVCSHKLIPDEPLFLVVQAQVMDDSIKLNAEKVLSISDLGEENFGRILLNIPAKVANKDTYNRLLDLIKKYRGNTNVYIDLESEDGSIMKIMLPKKYSCAINSVFFKDWETICGEETAKLKFNNLDVFMKRNNFKRRIFEKNNA